ncbi:hypothetical protein G6F40_013797 [Rhizopus arrhizus]|nr:hypothetical protein G6F40_013797 [Rhizopus arrhizus]
MTTAATASSAGRPVARVPCSHRHGPNVRPGATTLPRQPALLLRQSQRPVTLAQQRIGVRGPALMAQVDAGGQLRIASRQRHEFALHAPPALPLFGEATVADHREPGRRVVAGQHVESRQAPERLRGLDQRGGTHGARRGQADIAALCAEPCIPAAPALVTANAEGDVGVGGAHVWAHVAGFAQHGVEGDSIQGKGNRGGAEVEALAVVAGARFGIGVAPFATFMPIAQAPSRRFNGPSQRRAGQ